MIPTTIIQTILLLWKTRKAQVFTMRKIVTYLLAIIGFGIVLYLMTNVFMPRADMVITKLFQALRGNA
jgi:phage shock protein PspC (stress-responsive transcriptional regulator)